MRVFKYVINICRRKIIIKVIFGRKFFIYLRNGIRGSRRVKEIWYEYKDLRSVVMVN